MMTTDMRHLGFLARRGKTYNFVTQAVAAERMVNEHAVRSIRTARTVVGLDVDAIAECLRVLPPTTLIEIEKAFDVLQ